MKMYFNLEILVNFQKIFLLKSVLLISIPYSLKNKTLKYKFSKAFKISLNFWLQTQLIIRYSGSLGEKQTSHGTSFAYLIKTHSDS